MLLLEILTSDDELKKWYFPDSYFNNNEDSGFDLVCPEDIVIPAKSTFLIDTKCVFVLRGDDKQRVPFMVVPRSSIYKHPLRQSNSIGIIDKGYNGHLKIPVDNFSEKDYFIESGTRLFQICAPNLTPINCMTFVSEVEDTERGSGCFGSTGVFSDSKNNYKNDYRNTPSFWSS